MLSRSLKLALVCLATSVDAFAARGNVRRTTRLAAAADDFPRETARAAYSRFDDVCADEECDARELAEDNGWDELRRLARREEAQDRAAADEFPRETARAAYSRFDDVCADEECDARELAEDSGWDELRRLARREEAQDRAAAEKAAIAAFRLRLEERW